MNVEEAASAKLEQLKGSGWVVMYPSYIDKEMSIKDGRKVKAEFACEQPGIRDVVSACKDLNLDCLIEQKRYSKRWWVQGRCRIRIHNVDGSPCNTIVNSRKELYKEIGKRVVSLREIAKAKEAEARAAAVHTQKKGKKGKKGKR